MTYQLLTFQSNSDHCGPTNCLNLLIIGHLQYCSHRSAPLDSQHPRYIPFMGREPPGRLVEKFCMFGELLLEKQVEIEGRQKFMWPLPS
jgi:hypothetical protein